MYTVLIASFIIIIVIMGLSIFVTHKAYTRKWEDEHEFLDFDNQQNLQKKDSSDHEPK
jgi:hypothetical protein